MHIINGMNFSKKVNLLVNLIGQPKRKTIILTEHKEYVEDIFLNTHPILFNIEIKTLKEFEHELLFSHQCYNRQIVSECELTYLVRHYLKEDYHYLRYSDNPYSLIGKLITTLKEIHDYDVDLHTFSKDQLIINKCEDIAKLNEKITAHLGKDFFFNLEEATIDLIDDQLKDTDFYIFADEYITAMQRRFIQSLSPYTKAILLSFEDGLQEENLLKDFYEGEYLTLKDESAHIKNLSLHLFDNVKVEKQEKANLIIGGHPLQECMKVACDIKKKIHDGAHYKDFLIITLSKDYEDYLSYIFEMWNIPTSLPEVNDFHYSYDYKAIMEALDKSKGTTFKEHVSSLLKLPLTSLKDYISSLSFDDEISNEEMKLFIEATLPESKETVPSHDCIHFSTFKDSHTQCPYIYVMGINESHVPAEMSDQGLLLDEDYQTLPVHPLSLNKQLSYHHVEIIKTLTQPSHFTFSYAKMDMSGKEMMPSTLMKRLDSLYHLHLVKPDLNLIKTHLYLNHSYIPSSPINEMINEYKDNQPVKIDKKYINALGKGMSISRLETYNKCPFQYFIKYGLKINKKSDDQLLPTELGSLCHYIMEKAIDDPDQLVFYAHEYIDEHFKEKYETSALNQYFVDQLIDNMRVNVQIVREQLEHSEFNNTSREQEVKGYLGDIPVQGFIDRVDQYKDYVRIIDYKSGKKELNLSYAMQGFNIQMLAYLNLLIKEKNLKAGAVLYFNMKKRMLKDKIKFNKDIDEHLLYKDYQMKGYVIDEGSFEVIHASDEDSIPAKLKKDGKSPTKSSKLISQKELDIVMDHIIDYINTLYKQLRSGDISIRPTITDNGSDPSIYPCTFCDYKSVCLYDVFVNKNKEISSQLEKEVLKGEDNA